MIAWWPDFKQFVIKKGSANFISMEKSLITSEEMFYQLLSDFLFTSDGMIYRKDFQFANDLSCGKPAPFIKAC